MTRVQLGIVGLVAGLALGIMGARGTEWSVFHSNGVIRKESAHITYVGAVRAGMPFGIGTTIGGFGASEEVMDADLLSRLDEEQLKDVSIPVTITYAVPKVGVHAALNIEAADDD